jgi:hypothetical protein
MANILTKVYNSTLGIPQQLLLRLLRKMKQGDMNIFDEDGLMDMSLIPFLGILDEHENDASGADFTDSTGGALAIDILTDPVTFMTSGLTGAGKLAAALKKAGNTKGMEGIKSAIKAGDKTLTVGEVLEKAKLVSGSAKSGKHGVALRKLTQELAGNEGQLVQEALKKHGDEVLMWGFPGLTRMGASKTGPSTHTSWFKWMSDKSMSGTAKAAGMVGFKHLPQFKAVAKSIDVISDGVKSFSRGAKTPITPGLRLEYKHVDEAIANTHTDMLKVERSALKSRMEELAENNVIISDGYKGRLKEYKREGLTVEESHRRAFLGALGYKNLGRKAETLETKYRVVSQLLTGKPSVARGAKGVDKAIRKFHDDYADAQSFFLENERTISATPDVGFTDRLNESTTSFGKTLFKIGHTARKAWKKAFKTDVPIEGIEEQVRIANTLRDQGTEQAQEIIRAILGSVRELSKETGYSVENIRRLLSNTLESSFGQNEAHNLWLGMAQGNVKQTLGNLSSFLQRARTGISVISKVFSDLGLESPKEIVELAGLNFNELSQTSKVGIEKQIAYVTPQHVADVLGAKGVDPINLTRRQLPNKAGKMVETDHFGFLPTAALRQDARRLRKKYERPLAPSEVVDDLPLMQDFMDTHSMHPSSKAGFAKLLQDMAAGKERKTLQFKTVVGDKPHRYLPRRVEKLKSKRINIDKAGLRGELDALAEVYKRSHAKSKFFDRGKMFEDDLVPYYKELQRMINLRDTGKVSKYARPKDLVKKTPLSYTATPMRGFGPILGKDGQKMELGRLASAYVHLFGATEEATRWARQITGKGSGDEFFEEIVAEAAGLNYKMHGMHTSEFSEAGHKMAYAADMFDAALVDVVKNGLPERGKKLINATLDLRGTLSKLALESGIITGSTFAPGYLPRLLSPSTSKALGILGSKMDSVVIQKFMPQMSHAFPRDLRELRLEEVNQVAKELRKANQPKLALELEKAIEETGVKMELFESDPLMALANGLGNAMTERNTANFIDNIMGTQIGKEQMFGGQVIGYVTDGGKKFHVKQGVQLGAKLKDKDINYFEGPLDKDILSPHMLIKTDKGEVHVIPSNVLTSSGFSMRVLSDRGTTIGQKYALSAVDDTMHNVRMNVITDTSEPAVLESIMDKHVLIGNNSVLGSVDNTVKAQFQHGGQVLRAIDGMNYWLRKFQTVLRPAFHVSNLASGAFQGMMLGTRARNVTAGHGDAFRLLFQGDESAIRAYDRTAALLGETRFVGTGTPSMAGGDRAVAIMRAVRRMGPDGMLTKKAAGELALETGDLDLLKVLDEEVIELADGQVFTMGEILAESARGGLFGTFFAKGLGGAGSTPEPLSKLAERTLGKLEGGVATGKQSFAARQEGKLELSEVTSRFGTLFGRLREHGDLTKAVRETQSAMVDYSQLTDFERTWMKRAFLYYTFPVNYMPFAWKQFSKSPRGLGMLVDAVNDSGVVTTVNGQVEINFEALGADVSVSAQRLNANIDAAVAIPALIERLVPQEQLERHLSAPGVMATGGIGSIVLGSKEAFAPGGGRASKHWLEDAIYSTWATKLAYGGAKDLFAMAGAGGDTFLDYGEEFSRLFIPMKITEPGYERKLIVGNAQRLLRNLQKELEETTVPWRRHALMAEAEELQVSLKTALEEANL